MRNFDPSQEAYWHKLIQSSLNRILILHILREGASHGYLIRKKILEFSRGLCPVSEGGLYPALQKMEKEGILGVRSSIVWGRRRKVYYLTSKGRRVFEMGSRMWRQVVPLLEAIYRKKRGFRRIKVE